jgi:DNA-binding HxlR family transcriptional regulator
MAFTHAKPLCKTIEAKPGCMQAALAILGDKWSPLLIGHLVADKKTFGELDLMLGGISPRTLSARLDTLEKENIVEKSQYCKHPPRYKYGLTQKGQELRSILVRMAEWGGKYPD